MVITPEKIVEFAGILTALAAIGAAVWKIIVWVQEQEKQTEAIEKLRKKEAKDIKAMKEEQCLISYALLACLDGLKQQGCNGAVTEAHNRMQKHLNQMAHTQEDEEE